MALRTLVALTREDVRGQVTATLAELPEEVELLGIVENSNDLILAVDTNTDIDLVLIDSKVGPLPAIALVREVVNRVPDAAVLLMDAEPNSDSYQAAMEVGARGIVDSPPSQEELSARLSSVIEWQRQVRTLANPQLGGEQSAGRVIAITGAKGGVGTTTVAVHLAMLCAASNPQRRVCLIDLDLQLRGVRHQVEVPARRTISDLVSVADNLSGRNLDEATIVHPTGLRILVGPESGEHAEDIDGTIARQIIAAAKGHFDVVIIDAGTQVTEASAVGMEFADQLYVVATPDIPALRSVQDKLELLARLQVVKSGDGYLLINRASSRNEIQPEFGGRMATGELCRISLPEDWRNLEPAVNAMSPTDLEDGPFRRAIIALGGEMRLVGAGAAKQQPSQEASKRAERRTRRRRRREIESGQVTIEATVAIAVAMVLFLALMQGFLVAFGVVVGERAADRAALAVARGESLSEVRSAGEAVNPGFYDIEIRQRGDGRVEAEVDSISLLPWLDLSTVSEATAGREG